MLGNFAMRRMLRAAPALRELAMLEVVRQVSRRFPRTKTIILSMHADESYVLKALQNGAAGYVLKQADVADLLRAVIRAQDFDSTRRSAKWKEAGKLADFIVLSDDLLTINPRQIKDVEVAMTFVGGRVVYRR